MKPEILYSVYKFVFLFGLTMGTKNTIPTTRQDMNKSLINQKNLTYVCRICTDPPCRAVAGPKTRRIKMCSLESEEKEICLRKCHGRNCEGKGTDDLICEGDPKICSPCSESACLLVMNYTTGRYKKCGLTGQHRDTCAKKCPGQNCIIEVNEWNELTYRCEVCEICLSRGSCLVIEDKHRCIKSLCQIPRICSWHIDVYRNCRRSDHCVIQYGSVRCISSKGNLPGSYCGACKFGVCRDCKCRCWVGYGGKSCDRRCNKICENGGSCVFQGEIMYCACPVGLHGSKCNTRCPKCTQKMCRIVVDDKNITKLCEIDGVDRRACYNTCYDQHCMVELDKHKHKLYTCRQTSGCFPCYKGRCIFVMDGDIVKACADTNNESVSCGSSCQRCLKKADGRMNFTYSCLRQQTCVECNSNSTRCMIEDNRSNCFLKVCQIDREHAFGCNFVCPNSHCLISKDHKAPVCISTIPQRHYCLNQCVNGTCHNCSCSCNRGYIGKSCEKRCDTVCYNGGNCTEGNVCKCPPGFCHDCTSKWSRRYGFISCTKSNGGSLTECKTRCVHGTCKCSHCTTMDTFWCDCDPGYKGHNCSEVCKCGPYGICRNLNGREFCDCSVGEGFYYSGELCQTRVNIVPKNLVGGVVGGSVAVILISVAVATYVLWRKRNVWVLKLIHRFRFYEENDGKLFDAFVSYSGGEEGGMDHMFVYKLLRPMLEDLLPICLCIHHRDFSPGELIVDNIMWGIEESRRTIMLISSKYVQSAWCAEEYQKAQSEMLQLRHKVIPIFLEDPKHVKIEDQTLRHILRSVTYVQWPGIEDKEKLKKFWNQLVYSLPKKKNVDVSEVINASGFWISNRSGHSLMECDSMEGSSGYSSTVDSLNQNLSMSSDIAQSRSEMSTATTTSCQQEITGNLNRDEWSIKQSGIAANLCKDTAQLLETEFSMAMDTIEDQKMAERCDNETLSNMFQQRFTTKSDKDFMEMEDESKVNDPIDTITLEKKLAQCADTDYDKSTLDSLMLEKASNGSHARNMLDSVTLEKKLVQKMDKVASGSYLDSVTLEKKLAQEIDAKKQLDEKLHAKNVIGDMSDSVTLEKKRAQEVYNIENRAMDYENKVNKFDETLATLEKSKGRSTDTSVDDRASMTFEKKWKEWEDFKERETKEIISPQEENENPFGDSVVQGQNSFKFQPNIALNLTATISKADDASKNGGKTTSEMIDGEKSNMSTSELGYSELSCTKGDVVLGFDSEVIVNRL